MTYTLAALAAMRDNPDVTTAAYVAARRASMPALMTMHSIGALRDALRIGYSTVAAEGGSARRGSASRSYTAAERDAALAMHAEGQTIAAITRALGVPKSTLRAWTLGRLPARCSDPVAVAPPVAWAEYAARAAAEGATLVHNALLGRAALVWPQGRREVVGVRGVVAGVEP